MGCLSKVDETVNRVRSARLLMKQKSSAREGRSFLSDLVPAYLIGVEAQFEAGTVATVDGGGLFTTQYLPFFTKAWTSTLKFVENHLFSSPSS